MFQNTATIIHWIFQYRNIHTFQYKGPSSGPQIAPRLLICCASQNSANITPCITHSTCFELSDIVNVLNDLMKPVKLTSFLLQVCFKRVDRDRKAVCSWSRTYCGGEFKISINKSQVDLINSVMEYYQFSCNLRMTRMHFRAFNRCRIRFDASTDLNSSQL